MITNKKIYIQFHTQAHRMRHVPLTTDAFKANVAAMVEHAGELRLPEVVAIFKCVQLQTYMLHAIFQFYRKVNVHVEHDNEYYNHR